MSFNSQSHRVLSFLLLGLVTIALVVPVWANEEAFPRLTVKISDTTARKGDTNAWISIYVANYEDILAGFAMRVTLDRPDLIEFRTNTEDTTVDTAYQYCMHWTNGACDQWKDTLIIDTVIISGAMDTAGSLISGWQYVSARSNGTNRRDIKIAGLADNFGPPVKPGLPPQSQEGLLFRLKVRIYSDIPDTLTDKTVHAILVKDLSETNFSDPSGNLIGVITGQSWCDTVTPVPFVVDTFYRYWKCQLHKDPPNQSVCSLWTSSPDSTTWNDKARTIDTIPWSLRDTTICFYNSGSLTVILCKCGDNNNDTRVNVGDVVYLINYIFKQGPAPTSSSCADVNYDTRVNVGDVVYLINFIFKSGPQPNCGS